MGEDFDSPKVESQSRCAKPRTASKDVDWAAGGDLVTVPLSVGAGKVPSLFSEDVARVIVIDERGHRGSGRFSGALSSLSC